MKRWYLLLDCLIGLMLGGVSICFFAVRRAPLLLLIFVPLYFALNLLGGLFDKRVEGVRLRLLNHGAVLVCQSLFALVFAAAYHLLLAFVYPVFDSTELIYSAIFAAVAVVLPLIFGLCCMYLTSVQLGIKWRILCAAFALIPLFNIVFLSIAVRLSFDEVKFESEKIRLNNARAHERVCRTKYPVLLVHGFFFRDWTFFNYWGRIPKELEKNGATVYYGNHQSARPVPDAAAELAKRIREIVSATGCRKLNVIAHSKGGIDMRYALEHYGIAPMVASLITVSTPHRGCIFAERLLDSIPESVQRRAAGAYNRTLRALGDTNPDFLAAARDLTYSVCLERDAYPIPEGIYTASYGSLQKRAIYGRFPFNLSHGLVKHFDGENDGMVALSSFAFGESYTEIRPSGRQGISHGDMIDLNRRNIKGFDVRETYVQILSNLKRRGL